MFASLRKKFILTAMTAFVLTMVIIAVAINGGFAFILTERADDAIQMLYENDGAFPEPGSVEPEDELLFKLTEETPFETRYFVARFDEDGAATQVDADHVASIDQEEAETLARRIVETGRPSGYDGAYRYCVFNDEGGSRTVIGVDCSLSIQTAHSIASLTIAVGVACTLIALAILVPLSGRAIRPFVRNIERQQRFVTDTSHELKTPLAIISANTDLIEAVSGSDEGDTELSPWTKSTRVQIARLDSLVRDMVELTRADEGRQKLSLRDVDLSDIASQAAEDFDALAATQDKRLSSRIEPGIRVRGDSAALTRLCGILLDNAMKYCDEGGEVRIALRARRRMAEIRVSNPCATVTPEQAERFFDRFWRADESRSRAPKDEQAESGGYGIGLSIAKSIVEGHRGKIEARIKDGIVTLVAALPLAK